MSDNETSAQIDPDVKLPRHVLAQIQRSEQLMTGRAGDAKAADTAVDAALDATEQFVEKQDHVPAQSQQKEGRELVKLTSVSQKSRRIAKNGQAEPDKQEAQEGATEDKTQVKPQVSEEEHRYNSLKGRFEQSQADIRRMSENQRSMEALIADFASAKSEKQPEDVKSLLSPEDIESYGKDFLDVVGRKAQEVGQSEFNTLKAELAALKQQLGRQIQVSAVSAQERMYAIMDEEMPEWREINNDANFISWLALPDDFSGAIRHGLINQAVQQANASRVLAFFRGFLAKGATDAPQGGRPEQTDRANQTNGSPHNGKLSLETLAAPGRAKGPAASSQNAPEQKLSLTRTEIAGFYADVRAGKYTGRDQEKSRLENFIFKAQQDGRIT